MFGIIAEFKEQAPILMESERQDYSSVMEQYNRLRRQANIIRLCVVNLKYHLGNESLCPKTNGEDE